MPFRFTLGNDSGHVWNGWKVKIKNKRERESERERVKERERERERETVVGRVAAAGYPKGIHARTATES